MNYRLTELKVLLFLLLLSAVSCQRPMYDEEDDEDGVSQTNLPLKISARSSGESQINYPAYIYAFAEDGSCSASLKMTDNAQIEMKLPPARYTIVAIAGLGEEYIVPKDPSLDDVIVMKENNRSSRALTMGNDTLINFIEKTPTFRRGSDSRLREEWRTLSESQAEIAEPTHMAPKPAQETGHGMREIEFD